MASHTFRRGVLAAALLAASACATTPEPAATPGSETAPAAAEPPASSFPEVHLARFGAGAGPSVSGTTVRLLDAEHTLSQSNAVAWDLEGGASGLHASERLTCRMRVLEGGDGGAFLFLPTSGFGVRGPGPCVPDWTMPNLRGTFAVGIDVHDPKNEEPFGPWGNYQGLPEREVSLHWDGREIVKRVADQEFRGDFADVVIEIRHVCGGAEVSVRIGGSQVHDRTFVAGLDPYEMRPAVGAGTRADAATEFDVEDLRFEVGDATTAPRPPLHVEVFDHVRTDNSKTAYRAEVDLPPADWAFGRVLLTLEIHDAGRMWDEWDRCGEVSVILEDGTKLGIVPFITSYRTPWRWVVDVTRFRPLLRGKTTFEVEAGTTFYKNRGYLMSVALDFHHGTPALEPFRVDPLWVGTAHHGSAENHFQDFFAPREVAIDAGAKAARVYMTTTGHSQVGEFTPSRRAILFVPDRADAAAAPVRFEGRIWKDDCWLNPNRPQNGTWKYSRAGWAPGDVVRPWRIDLTPHLRPGVTAELRCETSEYDFPAGEDVPPAKEVEKASQIVRSYLVQYREPGTLLPAPSIRVLDVEGGGPAAKAGVRAGDWIESYDGVRIDTVDAFRTTSLSARASGRDTVKLVVVRGSERIELDVPPGRLGVQLFGR